MQWITHFCDECLEEGRIRLALATAQYQTKDRKWREICDQHITVVKDSDLRYEEFREPGNVIDLSDYQ